MEIPKIIVCIDTLQLEKATQYVNTNNTNLDVGISQKEVVDTALDSWSSYGYLVPIVHKGIMLVPQLAGESGEQLIYAIHIGVFASFELPSQDNIEIYDISLEIPSDEEIH